LFKFFIFFFHVLLFVFGISCNLLKEDSSTTNDAAVALLANSASTKSNCEEFVSSEEVCIKNPKAIVEVCAESEKTRLQSFISPKSARTIDSLESFFACWSRCNLQFNAKDSICSGSKYYDTDEYRKSQRVFTTEPSKLWGKCMDTCNGGASSEGEIQGVTFTGYGY